MVTRRQVRGWLKWFAVGVGGVGVLVYLLSFAGALSRVGPHRSVMVGRGAIVLGWSEHAMVERAPKGGAAIGMVPVAPAWRWESTRDRPWRWAPSWRADRSVDPRLVMVMGEASEPGRLTLPAWALAVIGLAGIYLLLPRDVPAGMCPRCRFDLRRTPAQPDRPGYITCPECGHSSRQPHAVGRGATPADAEARHG